MADYYAGGDDAYDDEYESEDAHGLGADEAVESVSSTETHRRRARRRRRRSDAASTAPSTPPPNNPKPKPKQDYRESLVLLIDASPEMLLPYDGSPAPEPQQQPNQNQQPTPPPVSSSLHVALELAYSLMRNLLTAGSRDEIAVLFYGLAPAKEAGGEAAATAATATTTDAVLPPPQPETTTAQRRQQQQRQQQQQQAFPGVVPLHPLTVPGADAMRRLRDLWRGDRLRFESQVGRILGEQDDEEVAAEAEAEMAAAAAAAGGGGTLVGAATQATMATTTHNQNSSTASTLAAKKAVRSGEALRMALWAARDTLRQQQGAGARSTAAAAASTTARGGTTTTTSSTRSARRVLVLSAAEDPTSLQQPHHLSAHDEASLLRVRDMVLERAGELGALGATLEVVPLGALRSSTNGVNMEAFWNPLMRRAQEMMMGAAEGAVRGAAGADNDNAEADENAENENANYPDNNESAVDGAQAGSSILMAPFYNSGRVEERIDALMAHVLRQVHRRRPLARSSLVLPLVVVNGNTNTSTLITIPVAVYSLVARPSTIQPAVLVAARDNEPLRVSTALQCKDTAATLAEVTHQAFRPGLEKRRRAKRGEETEAESAIQVALGPPYRYPDVVLTKAEAGLMRSAGPGRDAFWRFGGGGGFAGVENANADDSDEEQPPPPPTNNQNPAALAAGSYVYLGSKPLSALSDAHQLTAPVFLYPDEKQQGAKRGNGGNASSSSSSSSTTTACFSALHRALLETNRFALCRSGRRSAGGGAAGASAGAGLRLTALVPQAERVCARTGRQLQPPGFHAIALPFREDLRFPEMAPLPNVDKALKLERLFGGGGLGGGDDEDDGDDANPNGVPYYATERQVRAAEALIARLTFMDGGVDVGGPGSTAALVDASTAATANPPPFHPSRAINPALERHRQLVEAAALGERPPKIDWSGSGWTLRGGGGEQQQQQQGLVTADAANDDDPAALLLIAPPAPADDDGADMDDDNADNKQLATRNQQNPPPTIILARDLDPTLPDPSVFSGARDMIATFCDACGIGKAGRLSQQQRQEAAGGGQLKRVEKAQAIPAEDLAVFQSFDWRELARETTVDGSASGGLYGLTVDQLKTYLKAHALPLTGKKAEVVEKVREHVMKGGRLLEQGSAGGAAAPALLPAPPPAVQQPQQQQNKRRRDEEEQQRQPNKAPTTSTAPLAVPMSDDDDF
jgi:hypothetical protein